MGFLQNLFRIDNKLYYDEVYKVMSKRPPVLEEVKEIWERRKDYRGNKDPDDGYGKAPSLRSLFATLLQDAFSSNVVSGVDGFEMFVFLTDELKFKITDEGKLDEDDFSAFEYMLTTDRDVANEYDKYLVYVKNQITLPSIKRTMKKKGIKPSQLGKPFLNWLSKQEDRSDAIEFLYKETGSDLLLPQDAKDVFLF